MGKRATPSKSFNTVKHSNRQQRLKKHRMERYVTLLILLVGAAIILTGFIFLICSIADTVIAGLPPKETESGEGTQTSDVLPPVDLAFTQITKANSDVQLGVLQIVNQDHEYRGSTASADLKNIYENRLKYENVSNTYVVGQSSWKLNAEALDAFNQMLYKYFELEQDGSICITSAHRTLAEQEALNSSVEPGFSDHHTGYCVAIKQKTAEGNVSLAIDHWIYENCYKYGFIIRYPENKVAETGVGEYTHCLRYVGVAHATYIFEHDLCLEEYVELLQNNYTDEHLQINAADGKTYEVYYVPAGTGDLTTVSVPANYAYTVSGDNIGGFIVTVDLDAPNA